MKGAAVARWRRGALQPGHQATGSTHPAAAAACHPGAVNAAPSAPGRSPAAEPPAATPPALVSDSTARRFALDAIAAGVPKREVQKWVLDLSRNFYVTDDKSFEKAWWELQDRWKRNSQRRQRRRSLLEKKRASLEAGEPPLSGPEPPSQKRPRRTTREAAACAVAAEEDVRASRCASYEQALAVRLVLALGTAAADAMSELLPGEDTAPMKRLARLVHPDKTAHPNAKEAFQRLAPALREPR